MGYEEDFKKTLKEGVYPYNLVAALTEYTSKRAAEAIENGDNIEDIMEFSPSSVMKLLANVLTEREIHVIELRYRDKLTLDDCGEVLKVSPERVRQIEAKALHKLRVPRNFSDYACIPYHIYRDEKNARIAAEQRLNWFLAHGKYTVDTDYTENTSKLVRLYEKSIDELDLSVRAFNCLNRAGINTIGKVATLDYAQLQNVRNLGRRCFDEIVYCMHKIGLKMKWEENTVDTE